MIPKGGYRFSDLIMRQAKMLTECIEQFGQD